MERTSRGNISRNAAEELLYVVGAGSEHPLEFRWSGCDVLVKVIGDDGQVLSTIDFTVVDCHPRDLIYDCAAGSTDAQVRDAVARYERWQSAGELVVLRVWHYAVTNVPPSEAAEHWNLDEQVAGARPKAEARPSNQVWLLRRITPVDAALIPGVVAMLIDAAAWCDSRSWLVWVSLAAGGLMVSALVLKLQARSHDGDLSATDERGGSYPRWAIHFLGWAAIVGVLVLALNTALAAGPYPEVAVINGILLGVTIWSLAVMTRYVKGAKPSQ